MICESSFGCLFVVLLVLVGIFVPPFLCFFLYEKWQQRKWQKQLEELIKVEQEAIERKEEEISEFLLALELPQLVDRKKRLEIARRLRIALFVH